MKLTEQQLAQIFRQDKNTLIDGHTNNLGASTCASESRLKDVEKIANNSCLSASYQMINQLDDWSQNIGKDIEQAQKPHHVVNIFNGLKPFFATAAIVTIVYFMTPNMASQLENHIEPERIMFTGSFEKTRVKEVSTKSNKTIESDTIYKSTFS